MRALATERERRPARSRGLSRTSRRAESSHKQQHRLRLHRPGVHTLPLLRKHHRSPTWVYAYICSPLNSSIVTIAVGPTQRLFAAHEDVLCKSPYFQQACQAQFFEPANKRIALEHEDPEVFSAVLEYLYKGDYSPQLAYDKKRSSFYLSTRESTSTKTPGITVQYNGVSILKDTAIYVRLLLVPFLSSAD